MRMIFGAAALLAATAAHAQTAAEIAACKPDALALCSPGIADLFDHARVAKCLAAHKQKLSLACRAVLASHKL